MTDRQMQGEFGIDAAIPGISIVLQWPIVKLAGQFGKVRDSNCLARSSELFEAIHLGALAQTIA